MIWIIPFQIIGLTETWLKPHNVDCFFIKGYSHEYNIRPKRTGGGVSLFIADSLIFTCRNNIKFNSIFNSIIIDIDKTELNSKRNVSIIIIYRPPNAESILFINELDRILTALNKENRDIFLIGDFNYDTYKSSIYQSNKVNSENFTNALAGFSMFKFIYKPTRIKSPCATLLDNIYTNIQTTIDSSKSGIIISDISDHFFVFGIFDDIRFNPTHYAFKTRCFTEDNIVKISNILNNKKMGEFIYK